MSACFVLPTITLPSVKQSPLMSGELVIVKTEHGEKLHVSCKGELVPLAPPPISWEKVRVDAAIAAMQGILANPASIGEVWRSTELAIRKADELIAELQKEVAK